MPDACNIFVGTTLPYDVGLRINNVVFDDCVDTRACKVRKLILLGLEQYEKSQKEFHDGF